MKRTIALAACALALTACSVSTGDGNTPATVPAGSSAASSAAASGDWKFAQVKVKGTDGLYTGTMRATNTTGEKRSALFTVTAFDKKGGTLGTLTGAANDVAANATVTVTLVSGDDLKGAVKYEVQADVSG